MYIIKWQGPVPNYYTNGSWTTVRYQAQTFDKNSARELITQLQYILPFATLSYEVY